MTRPPVPPIVDPMREVVIGDDRLWRFTLDCRADVAAIDLGGTLYRVRPLRWSEKRNLARYHRVGPGFLERQFVLLCLETPAALPDDPADCAALAALAFWINAPGEERSGLPLDPDLLAAVSREVGRQVGCKPDELDARPASEVERHWAARRPADDTPATPQPAPQLDNHPDERPERPAWQSLDDPGELNRILIVPDRSESPFLPLVVAGSLARKPGFEADPPEADGEFEVVAGHEPTAASPEPVMPTQRVNEPPSSPVGPMKTRPTPGGKPAGRFRVVFPSASSFGSRGQAPADGDALGLNGSAERPDVFGDTTAAPGLTAWTNGRDVARPGWSALDVDEVFEEWQERLDEAAAELGIDAE